MARASVWDMADKAQALGAVCRAHWTCGEARGKSGGIGSAIYDRGKCPPKLREFCTKEFGQLASAGRKQNRNTKVQSEMEDQKSTERKQKAGMHQQA